jgi:hypothetical protein
MAPPVQPPVPLFPPPPTLKFAEDGKLQGAVKKATDSVTRTRGKAPVFRVAIVDLADESPSGTLKFGAYNGDTVDFIASEAKLIALYAAFALRDMVERFAAALKTGTALVGKVVQALGASKAPPAPDLFDALRANMNRAILDAADPRLAGIDRDERLPDYKAVFDVLSGGAPHFTTPFQNALREMIVPSNNDAASTVISGVGFAYISGAMKAAGLLAGGKGPWLSADFAAHYHPLMDSANDNMVGQAGTALSLAKLMALVVTGAVPIRSDSFKHMKRLLHDAVDGPDKPFLTRPPPDFKDKSDTDPTKPPLRIPRSNITHIKLGEERLKPRNGGYKVGSEVWRLEGLYKTEKVYAVSFQNLAWRVDSPADLAFVIRDAIWEYEK